MSFQPPELYPDPEAVHRAVFDSGIVGVWTALPGYIVSFDPETVTASVQIGIRGQVLQQDGSVKAVELKPLQDVPVVFPRGGGCTLTFPVKPDDECFVVFACRSIDAWWQNGDIQAPSDSRTHDLSDGLCFVGPMTQKNKIADIDPDMVQLRSDDASTLVELDPAGQAVRIVAPGGVIIDAPTVNFTGDVIGAGSATFSDDVVGAGVSLQTHLHSAVESGTDESGPPVP